MRLKYSSQIRHSPRRTLKTLRNRWNRYLKRIPALLPYCLTKMPNYFKKEVFTAEGFHMKTVQTWSVKAKPTSSFPRSPTSTQHASTIQTSLNKALCRRTGSVKSSRIGIKPKVKVIDPILHLMVWMISPCCNSKVCEHSTQGWHCRMINL